MTAKFQVTKALSMSIGVWFSWDPPNWSHFAYLVSTRMKWSPINLFFDHVSLQDKRQKDVKMSFIPVQEKLSVLTADFTISEAPFGTQSLFCYPVIACHLRGIVRWSKTPSALSHHHSPETVNMDHCAIETQGRKGKGKK